MWIQTQNRQRIINSDQVIDIFIDKQGKNIYAETTCNGEAIVLGVYKDRDSCLIVLDKINLKLISMCTIFAMPLGGEI